MVAVKVVGNFMFKELKHVGKCTLDMFRVLASIRIYGSKINTMK